MMSLFAALMTGQGTGAISTIVVFGASGRSVIEKIFEPAGNKPAILKPGKILLGKITDAGKTIDEVALGCEGTHTFAVNCHGNPLIVADIMKLLSRHGAKVLTAQQLWAKILCVNKTTNTIAIEAKIAQAEAKTIEGTKIILNQIEAGLSKIASQWSQNIEATALDKIKAEADRILTDTQTAKLIIAGCRAAIAGPPNSGKSTLLNYLSGRQKAIVTDIKGTTRDWVSAQCKIGPLLAELIDTAGSYDALGAPADSIEKASQQKTSEVLENAELVLLVLDGSRNADEFDTRLLEKIAGKKVLTVLNKSDLPARLNKDKLPEMLSNTVQISAKFGTGIDNLLGKIQQIFGVADFDLNAAVCFTSRQERLLRRLQQAQSIHQAASLISELLNGQIHL